MQDFVIKAKRAMKRVAAVSAGAALVGASMFGAVAAQDLMDYPHPWIDGGVWSGLIVVGGDADPSDVVGAIDLAAALGQEMSFGDASSGTTVTGGRELGDADFFVSDGVGPDPLTLFDIDSYLDDTDLDILADGYFEDNEGEIDNSEKYTQILEFTDVDTNEFRFDQDDDLADDAGFYFWIDDSSTTPTYQYTLEFDNPIDFDPDDINNELEGVQLTIMDQLYTITDAALEDPGTDDWIASLTLMKGDTVMWLSQGQPQEISGSTVEVIDVNDAETKCGVDVDGTLKWIDVDTTAKFGGLTIGVTDAIAVHQADQTADACELNIGATELELKDGQEIEVNGVDLDGSNVDLDVDAAYNDDEWDGMIVTFYPEDEHYLAEGDEWIDPVFNAWKFVNLGLSDGKEDVIDVQASGDDATITFMNKDGKEVVLPLIWEDAGDDDVILGEDDADVDQWIYTDNGVCVGTTSVEDCEGAKFLAINNGDLHVIEITDINPDDDEMDFEDLTYGTSDDELDYTGAMTLGSGLGAITLTVNEGAFTITFTDIDLDGAGANEWETEYEGMMDLDVTPAAGGVGTIFGDLYYEERLDEGFQEEIDISMAYDSAPGDEVIEIDAPGFAVGEMYGPVDFNDANDDNVWYVTEKGTTVAFDEGDQSFLTITSPDDALYLTMSIAKAGSTVSTRMTGGGTPIGGVPVAKMDNEITDKTGKPMILVGDSCVNTLAAEVAGVTYPTCGTGLTDAFGYGPGEATIQLFENAFGGENVAMLVAGWDAADTRNAAMVLKNYGAYDLSGDQVIVRSSEGTITVGAPTVA